MQCPLKAVLTSKQHKLTQEIIIFRVIVYTQGMLCIDKKKTTWTTELIYSKCMKQTGFMTCKTQSSKKFRTLQKENKENLYCLWAKSRVTFHTITSYESCLACQHFLSNRTNHKLCKKLADQKCLHMSLRLCGIQKQYCALIRRHSIQGFRVSAL